MSSRTWRRFALAVAASALCLLWPAVAAPGAYADGDPASDVLTLQSVFVPTDADVPVREQLELTGLLKQAARRGYPLRVAIIASPTDLGSVAALWRHPESYARFLGSELALVFHGTVLVVMPNGYGSDVNASGTRTASGEAELPLPGQRFGSAAIAAVERFAAAAGVPLATPGVRSTTVSRPFAPLPWIVFGAGLIPLGLAWGLSLRRRPIRLRAADDQPV